MNTRPNPAVSQADRDVLDDVGLVEFVDRADVDREEPPSHIEPMPT